MIRRTSRSYLGVRAATPPDLITVKRIPTVNDYREYIVGTIWMANISPTKKLYVLMSKAAGVATWSPLNLDSAPGDVTSVTAGDNINCTDPGGPIVIVNLNKSIDQPATSTDGTEGVYAIDGNDFLHAYGSQNTFVGSSAGNRTLTTLSSMSNTGIGSQSLNSLTTGGDNTAIGVNTLLALTTGDSNFAAGGGSQEALLTGSNNTSIGVNTLSVFTGGDNNVALGFAAGINYAGVESDNILISHPGVLGESDTIHIGASGTHTDTYIAGVYTHAIAGVNELVAIDSNGRLGISSGTDGQIVIGATGGASVWADLVSGDGTITIAQGANTIDIRSVGGGGGGGAATFITDDNSPAVIDVANITFAGEGVLKTDGGLGSHTVTTRITNGTDGQILVAGGAAPVWANLTSTGASITITEGANTINLEAVGAGGGANTFTTDSGDAVSVAGTINVLGGTNINTSGATDVLTVNLDTSIALPATNTAGTSGLYSLDGSDFMHAYGTDNTFLGGNAGSRALTVLSAIGNVGIGYDSISSLTTGSSNTFVGYESGKDVTTGTSGTGVGYGVLSNCSGASLGNTALGFRALNTLVSGDYNIGVGYLAGVNLTADDSDNILIGNDGVSGLNSTTKIGTTGTQTSAYIAGVYGVATGATKGLVEADSDGRLGTTSPTADGQILIGASDGSTSWATINEGSDISVVNGTNQITISSFGGGSGGGVLPGSIMRYDPVLPTISSWLRCDGSVISQTTYNNLFAAIGHMYDLPEFSLITPPFIVSCMAYNPDEDKWIAIGRDAAGTRKVSTTIDGVTWSSPTNTINAIGGYVYHNQQASPNGRYVISSGNGGSPQIATSTDGITWTQGIGVNNSAKFRVKHNGKASPDGTWIVTQASGISRSTDGITWTVKIFAAQYTEVTGLVYSESLDRWIISFGRASVIPMADSSIYISDDQGITWTKTYSLPNASSSSGYELFSGLAMLGEKIVAITNGGDVPSRLIMSDNGIDWEFGSNLTASGSYPNSNYPNAIGNSKTTIFVSFSYGTVKKSTDGINWEDIAIGISGFSGAASNMKDHPYSQVYLSSRYGVSKGVAPLDPNVDFQLPIIENSIIST